MTASIVLMGKPSLDEEAREKLLLQSDINKTVVGDRSIKEILLYQIFIPDAIDQIFQAFRDYVDDFGLDSTMFPFLAEFD